MDMFNSLPIVMVYWTYMCKQIDLYTKHHTAHFMCCFWYDSNCLPKSYHFHIPRDTTNKLKKLIKIGRNISQGICVSYYCSNKNVCVCAQSCQLFCKHLCSWDFPGKNVGTGCHFLFQEIFPIQGSKVILLHLLHWQAESLPLSHLGSQNTQALKQHKFIIFQLGSPQTPVHLKSKVKEPAEWVPSRDSEKRISFLVFFSFSWPPVFLSLYLPSPSS